ncbi:MAG: hypothetical protein ACREON_06330, partial [Gemmatimonadaceae bacterium]
MSVAPLKPHRLGIDLEAPPITFPRSDERGSIEALQTKAPTHRSSKDFPRSDERGSIEATDS